MINRRRLLAGASLAAMGSLAAPSILRAQGGQTVKMGALRLVHSMPPHFYEKFAPPGLKIEIIEQVEDTVVIMVPPRPEAEQALEQELTRVTEQVFDLLFSSGIGGFFIPDETQKWVLREIRLAAQAGTGRNVREM